MTKAELESKHLSELHSLAAEAGVERYRMLTRAELVERLAGGNGNGDGAPAREPRSGRGEREGSGGERPRRRRSSSSSSGSGPSRAKRERVREPEADEGGSKEEATAEPEDAGEPEGSEESARPRRRRRRRFGRRGKQGVTLEGLLLPPEAGRQAVLCAESREACTALLRSVAADLAADAKGPDPVVLLIDPSPEELGDWRRKAPEAEIVAAGQPRHADDALAQAKTRAGGGEDVILLVDSLTRLGEAYADAGAAKAFFDAGRVQGAAGGGSLTVVAALERPTN